MTRTREQAIDDLRQCSAGHWITTISCDSCWVNEHRCPPTLDEIEGLLREADQLRAVMDSLRRKVARVKLEQRGKR